MKRRDFLEMLGAGATGIVAAGSMANTALAGPKDRAVKGADFKPLNPTFTDNVVLADGFKSEILVKWGEQINPDGTKFGFANDFLAFLPDKKSVNDSGYLFVNHEAIDELSMHGQKLLKRTKQQADMERAEVGISVIKIKRDPKSGRWAFVKDKVNKRIDGTSKIPLIAEDPIAGSKIAEGTLGNCSGGQTPWGTFLTCEENVDNFYTIKDKQWRGKKPGIWQQHYNNPGSHYGWVVEVEPVSGRVKKLCALGRFAHEGALVVGKKKDRCAVYMGDDANDRCIYKFLADKPGSLETGTLYVADLDAGKWLPLDLMKQPKLKKLYKNKTQMLVDTREAARIVGGTPTDRPEGIARNPRNGDIFVALTKNSNKNDHYGSLLRIQEKDNDPMAMEFKAAKFLNGGLESGMANPDNLAFDARGNLWVTTDIYDVGPDHPIYKPFGNNSLFVVPTSGSLAGKPLRVASAPTGAEFTGPCFLPDGKTLLLSVQHPGEGSKETGKWLSHWPEGGRSMPKPSVIAISGPKMKQILS